jgi:hypothetical protein
VGGVLLGILAFPQAALAQGEFTAAITQGNDPQLDIGGASATVNVSVMATFGPGQGPKDVELKGRLSGLDGLAYVGVGGACEIKDETTVKCAGMNSGETREVQFMVTTSGESDLTEGQTQSGQLNIDYNGGSLQTSVTVRGTAAAGVSSINGSVQSNGAPVEGAEIEIEDSEGNKHDATTDGSGNYTVTGDSSNPIVAGDMQMTVTAEGFEEFEDEFTVNEGSQSFTQNVTLTPLPEETTSSAAPTSEAPTSASATPDSGGEDEGMSGTLIILIIIGALLVVGGIVGIVFLLRGGKDDKDDDAESFAPDGPPDHTPTAAQVGTPGVYQAGPAPGSDAPTMIHPGGLVDAGPAAPTQFGPAYGGGSDSTQVMPQGGFGAAPGMPGGQVGPDGTTILPVVKQPGGPGASDATQIMPQANLGSKPPASAPPSPYGDLGSTRPHPSAPSSPYADPGATRPHPGPTPAPSPSPYGDLGSTRPHAAPTPPPATGSMFEPQNPGIAPGAPSERSYGSPSAPPSMPSERSYGSPSAPPSAPQYGPGSQSYGAQGGQQGYGSPSAPPSAPRSAPPNSGDPYSSQSMRRDPYAPQEQPPPLTGEYGATRAMPQHGGEHSQPPAAPYGGEPNREAEDPDAKPADRRNWGEWDDRPRSW